MGISLKKGQRISLSKELEGLSKVSVGLGWDPIKQGGFLSRMLGTTSEMDIDASVLMLNQKGKLETMSDLIYFNNKTSDCGSVRHQGDNTTGHGEGDDETIKVDLTSVPSRIHKLVFVVNIYDCTSRKQTFDMVENAYIRLLDDQQHKKEMVKYDLNENYVGKTALIVGELTRVNREWEFTAIGQPTNDTSLQSICNKYL